MWTDHGGESDFIDVEAGRWAPIPRGIPAARPLGFVFRNEREGAAFLVGVGLAATTDGGASWRLVRETGAGDAARVQSIRFRDGAVEARDADHRPAIVDVAAATLGPFRGGTRVLGDEAALRVPPPRGDELPLEYWMRGSEQNPFVLAIDDGGAEAGGRVHVSADGLVALVDIAHTRVTGVAGGDKSWGTDTSTRPAPGDHVTSGLSGGRQATVQGIWDDAGEPHVEVSQRSGTVKHPLIFFAKGHGKLSLLSPIEEDKDHALHFVLGDENGAYVVIQRSAAVPAAAIPIPGARYALLHGAHGIAVGPGHVLVSSDGGATWADVPPPRGLDQEVAALGKSAGADIVVSPYGARVGNLVRVGWGPAEPSPPEGPPESVVAVPDDGPEPAAPTLVCTTPGHSPGAPPGAQSIDALLKAAVGAALKASGASADVLVTAGPAGSFVTSIAFAHDDAAHVWAAGWLDKFDIGAVPRTWSAPAPPWASENASLTTLAYKGGKALLSIASSDRTMLVRVEPDGAYETAEVPSALSIQNQIGVAAARRGPLAWIEGSDLMLWQWGEDPRSVLTFAGAAANLSAEDPVPRGLVIRELDPGFGVYRILPYPAPGERLAPLGLEGWTRFDAASEHPDRFPVCGKKPFDTAVNVAGRPLVARIDGNERRTDDQGVYRLRMTGGEACVAAVWARFGDGVGSFALRVDLVEGRAEGGVGAARPLSCAWHPAPGVARAREGSARPPRG